jgi:RNA polymerase sigma-70 factor (ECF subfamily)
MSPVPADFAAVYDAYHARVRAYAAKLVGREDADDVAQQVFLKVSRGLDALADPARLSSWIYAITLNTVRDAARAAATRPAPARGSEAALAGVASRSRSPEEAASRGEMVACYVDYVNRLPPDYHHVYVLAEFEHLPAAEIARLLGVSIGTVKIRLHRARSRLYEELRRNCRCYYNERGELMGEPKKG